MYRLENIEDLKVGTYFTYCLDYKVFFDKIISINSELTEYDGCIECGTISSTFMFNLGIVTTKVKGLISINRDLTKEPKPIIVLNDDDAKFFIDMFAKIDAVNAIRDNTIKTIEQSLIQKLKSGKQS